MVVLVGLFGILEGRGFVGVTMVMVVMTMSVVLVTMTMRADEVGGETYGDDK